MKQPEWILRDTVLALHEELLAEFGGASGVRDEGLLASALARPENLLAHGKSSVFALAASYACGLVKNHAFADGNKRVGFTVAVLFLEINGYRFHAAEADAVVRTLALAAGKMSKAAYGEWLRANAKPS
jgi:death on curing protein